MGNGNVRRLRLDLGSPKLKQLPNRQIFGLYGSENCSNPAEHQLAINLSFRLAALTNQRTTTDVMHARVRETLYCSQ